MWKDYGYIGWAIIIADFIHQILWVGFHFLFGGFYQRNIGMSILPDILAAFISINILWALFPLWKISGSPAIYGVIAYAVLLNLQLFFRYLRAQRGNPKRLQIFWWAGLNLGLGLFLIERLAISFFL